MNELPMNETYKTYIWFGHKFDRIDRINVNKCEIENKSNKS